MILRCLTLTAAALMVTLPAVAHAQVPLTPERYAALDGAFSGFLPLDGTNVSSSDYAAARAACRSMDSADPLLGPLRRSCTATVKFAKTLEAVGDCGSQSICRRRARSARIAVNDVIRRSRQANGAASSAMLVKGCYRQLRTTKSDLRLLERFRGFLRLTERVLVTGSATLSLRLLREAVSIDRAVAKQPSAARELNNFRAACAPPAA